MTHFMEVMIMTHLKPEAEMTSSLAMRGMISSLAVVEMIP